MYGTKNHMHAVKNKTKTDKKIITEEHCRKIKTDGNAAVADAEQKHAVVY